MNCVLSLALFLSALRCSSLKISLVLLPRLLSRLSSLKFLKFRRFFLHALFCSLSRCASLNMISWQKNEVCQTQRCHAISRQGKFAQPLPSPEAVLSPQLHPDSLYRRAGGRTYMYADIINKISRMDRFPKKSYPWCSACVLCTLELH